ncbi:MarR family winged helix-turn-helix transcriptional regulator [Mycolicibacterium sp.]|uniref:MarR family winged helix-turn-helix transcriptional regulator n=1 Tax=Mycolicibacterium sp. TaxID=2320850 RepID=UPI003D1091BB
MDVRPAGPQLLGPLLDLLTRRVRSAGEAELLEFGMRPRHVVGLTLLRDLGERSQTDLAEDLRLDPTNVVALLNELEAEGLIERRRSPQDRRRHTVVLTPAGAERLADVEAALGRLEQRLFAGLDDQEQVALHGLLLRAVSCTGGTGIGPCTSGEHC